MPDKSPEEKDGLLEIIKKLWLPVAGFIGVVTLAYNFYKMWLGDQQTVTYITVGAGLIVLGIVSGWVKFSKKSVKITKGRSSISNRTERIPRYSPFQQKIATIGLVIIFLAVEGGIFLQIKYLTDLDKKAVVVIAAFDGPETDYGIRDQIVEQLTEAIKGYNDVIILPVDEVVTSAKGSDYARELGYKNNADLVIWAWYKPTDDPNITIHIENLYPERVPIFDKSEKHQPSSTSADLKSFKIQKQIASETSSLVTLLSGYIRYQENDYTEALARFDEILNQTENTTFVDKNKKEILFFSGNCLLFLDRYDESARYFNDAISIDPHFAEAYSGLGYYYFYTTQYDSAIKNFDISISEKPDYYDAYAGKGITFYLQKKYEDALGVYTKAASLDAKPFGAYVGLGLSNDALGYYDLAIENYTKAIALRQDLEPPYGGRAISYQNKGDQTSAIADFTKSIELKPGDKLSYFLRAQSYLGLKEYEKAINDFNETIKIDPYYEAAYGYRGLAYQGLGKTAEAEADFAKYKELTGKDAP